MAEYERVIQAAPSIYDISSLEQVRGYLDALADGMDPVTGQPATAETLSSQAVRSWLRYASLVVGDSIRLQEIRTKKAAKPFFLTAAQVGQLRIRDRPCLVSDIANEISRVSGNKKMQTAWITTWLQAHGYLEAKDGIRAATEKGQQIGITTEVRNPKMPGNGQVTQEGYSVNRYSADAQRFILDHLEDILEFHYNGVSVAHVDFDLMIYPIRATVREFLAKQPKYCIITAAANWSPDTKIGSYIAGLCYKDTWKVIEQEGIRESNATRVVLQGVLEAVKMLKKPTNVLLLLSPDPGYTDPKHPDYSYWRSVLEALAQARCTIRLSVCQSRGDEIARLLKAKQL